MKETEITIFEGFALALLIGLTIGLIWRVVVWVGDERRWERARAQVLREYPELRDPNLSTSEGDD